MRPVYWFLGLLLLTVTAVAAYFGAGGYNVAADEPHGPLTDAWMVRVRTSSVAARASHVEVPKLDDMDLVTAGAGNYDAMCTGCHLKPGLDSTELSRGLYPKPPDLARQPAGDPAVAFWTIKHGIKLSGMPAWGQSMEDQYIWGLVAFLGKLPALSADDYRELVEASGGHRHGGSKSGVEEAATPSKNHSDDDDHSQAPPHQH
jgi:mono/diheme cytochrome c family protein